MRAALCRLRFQTASAMRQERGNLVRHYCLENGRPDSCSIKTLEIEYFDADEAV